jgi:ornithine cyclodeaminase
MLVLDAEQIRSVVSFPSLIERLKTAFLADWVVPQRQILSVPGGNSDRCLFAMPAFTQNGAGVFKLTSLFPGNAARDIPTIQGVTVVFSDEGSPVAVLDGGTITRLRTAAASALASTYLSRTDSAHLVLIGTGALAPDLVAAHRTVRPITKVSVWGRTPNRVKATVGAIQALEGPDFEVLPTFDLGKSVSKADIVTCATGTTKPLLEGSWLSEGTFVDLVGSFSPSKREADDQVVVRSRIFVDTFEGALSEAGDLIDPLERGIIARDRIEAELCDLISRRKRGRTNSREITLFKSVGTAIEDLAAAQMVVESFSSDLR